MQLCTTFHKLAQPRTTLRKPTQLFTPLHTIISMHAYTHLLVSHTTCSIVTPTRANSEGKLQGKTPRVKMLVKVFKKHLAHEPCESKYIIHIPEIMFKLFSFKK